jgi:hypothetical protein
MRCSTDVRPRAGSPELEKPNLLRPRPQSVSLEEDGVHRVGAEGRRPADVYVPRWRSGTPVAFDFAVPSGLQRSLLHLSAQDREAALLRYEGIQHDYLDTRAHCQAEGITYGQGSGGGRGPDARKVRTVGDLCGNEDLCVKAFSRL